MLCAKKIRRALEEDKAPIKPLHGQARTIGVTAAPSSIQITLDNILFFLGKTELNVKEGAGYLRSECELDLEDEDEDAGSDGEVKKKSLLNVLDRTEELETEDTIVQQQRPDDAITMTSSEDEDVTMETVSTDQERMPVTPTNKQTQVLASTVQKSNAHKARRMSPILSPISKGNNMNLYPNHIIPPVYRQYYIVKCVECENKRQTIQFFPGNKIKFRKLPWLELLFCRILFFGVGHAINSGL